jgi:GrpB-like predicted nucleotidyltransferase (UPF0157 family)/RimJ/RimL family protein N-acetyltransferase
MDKEKRKIEVVEYDNNWPAAFQKEANVISAVLSEEIVHIHHIGSTAVHGLNAKPVIDILLEVKNVESLDCYNSRMEDIGYIPKGEFGIPGRRFYLKGLYHRTHHIHAFKTGSPDVARHIVFRDYLIAHPLIAWEYANLKARCAAECNDDNDKYCAAKHEFVTTHEKKALAWNKSKAVKLIEAENTVKQFDHGLIQSKLFQIVRVDDGLTVGGISLRYTDNEYLTNYRGHIGFTIEEPYRRRGYATAAIKLVLQEAQQLGMKKIVITCRHDNIASELTIRKAGLIYESIVDVPENTYLWNNGITKVKRFSIMLWEQKF